MTHTNDWRGSWLAHGAALWALVFGVLHIVWAAGWHIGLAAEEARKAFDQPWFLAYDLLAAVMCMIAVAVALALARPWGRRSPRRLVAVFAWGATGLLALRSGAGIIQVLYLVITGTFVASRMYFWESWFYVGAILFALSTWKFCTARPEPTIAN